MGKQVSNIYGGWKFAVKIILIWVGGRLKESGRLVEGRLVKELIKFVVKTLNTALRQNILCNQL